LLQPELASMLAQGRLGAHSEPLPEASGTLASGALEPLRAVRALAQQKRQGAKARVQPADEQREVPRLTELGRVVRAREPEHVEHELELLV
jgi:hypothetical protein